MMQEPFDQWAIVELFGHRRLAGRVREVELFGGKMCHIDIPQPEGRPAFSQLYGGAAIFSVTPCSEETARSVAEYAVSPDYKPDFRPRLPEHDANRATCECGNDKDPNKPRCWECESEDEIISSPPPEATETNLEQPCEC